MAAIAAPLDVTAERGGAATLDRNHGMPLRGGQRNTSATSSPSRATGTALQAGTRSGAVGTMTFRDSSGLAVAQTLLVAIIRYWAVVLRLR
jgi:hypothetical protein